MFKVLAGGWIKEKDCPLGEEGRWYRRPAVAMGETVSESMRWATGSFTGVDGLGI